MEAGFGEGNRETYTDNVKEVNGPWWRKRKQNVRRTNGKESEWWKEN